MAWKNKEKAAAYYRKYYQEKKKPKYVPRPRKLLTKEEKLAKKRAWYHENAEKCKAAVKKYAEANKEKKQVYNKLYRKQNKQYLDEQAGIRGKKWYDENKQRHYLNGLMWKNNNPGKVKQIRSKFVAANPEKIKQYLRKYNLKTQARYRLVKSSAKRRNYPFDLTLEQYQHIIEQPCSYCGENEKKIGVDRVDNTQGYTKDNSTPCCKTCNMMKKDATVEYFLNHVQKIVNHSR